MAHDAWPQIVTSECTIYLIALCAVGLLIFGTLCSWRFPGSNSSRHLMSYFQFLLLKAANLDFRILLNVHVSYNASEVQAAYDLNMLTECQMQCYLWYWHMLQFLDVLTQVRIKMVELSKYQLTLLNGLFKIVKFEYVKTMLSLHFTLKHNLAFPTAF